MTFLGLLMLCFLGTICLGFLVDCVDWKRIVRNIINKIEQSQQER